MKLEVRWNEALRWWQLECAGRVLGPVSTNKRKLMTAARSVGLVVKNR